MDKNGQNRGGARKSAGRKPKGIRLTPKPKNQTNNQKKSNAEAEINRPAFFNGEQFGGTEFLAGAVLEVISGWLSDNEVLNLVPAHLLEMYSSSFARWMQAEEHLNKTGFLAKHPTTGAPIASPYVALSLDFQKMAQGCWWQIYQMMKDATEGKKRLEEPTNGLLEILKKEK